MKQKCIFYPLKKRLADKFPTWPLKESGRESFLCVCFRACFIFPQRVLTQIVLCDISSSDIPKSHMKSIFKITLTLSHTRFLLATLNEG